MLPRAAGSICRSLQGWPGAGAAVSPRVTILYCVCCLWKDPSHGLALHLQPVPALSSVFGVRPLHLLLGGLAGLGGSWHPHLLCPCPLTSGERKGLSLGKKGAQGDLLVGLCSRERAQEEREQPEEAQIGYWEKIFHGKACPALPQAGQEVFKECVDVALEYMVSVTLAVLG